MRSVPEWRGKTDDQSVPPRVKARVYEKFEGRCTICTLEIVGKLKPEYDHVIALCNGGEHAENNLSLLCMPCHKGKSRADVAIKAIDARVRAKHLGLQPTRKKIQSAGFQKSPPQRTASRPIERRS